MRGNQQLLAAGEPVVAISRDATTEIASLAPAVAVVVAGAERARRR